MFRAGLAVWGFRGLRAFGCWGVEFGGLSDVEVTECRGSWGLRVQGLGFGV